MTSRPPIYGVVAEFDSPTTLVAATKGVAEAGYQEVEAYTPYQIEELSETIKPRYPLIPLIVFTGGLFGGLGGFFMQYYVSVLSYPLNVGGRPLDSWPMYIPITFELAVLAAAVAAILGVLVLCRLPMPYHPLFKAKDFARASQDRFFLCVKASDPKFDRDNTTGLLLSQNALGVSDVFD